MLEEHHISEYDSGVFFALHDTDNDGFWSLEEVERFYGLWDPTFTQPNNAPPTDYDISDVRQRVTSRMLELYDTDDDARISLDEFVAGLDSRKIDLPDFGYGPGHHGDDEYEYEIHHFEKYHSEPLLDENGNERELTEEDLNHPEDLEHFRMHEQKEVEEEALQRRLAAGGILEENVPTMFRRPGTAKQQKQQR